MKWILGPVLLYAIFIALEVASQENAVKNLSPSLIECYEEELYRTWNHAPHSIQVLINIIRKIEDHSARNVDVLDMRYLATALLHRFRQDGIVRNPNVRAREGIIPYAPLGSQFYRHAQTLRVIPGNAFNFPNDSLSAVERCTLHSMLSSSIDMFDLESKNCKFANYAFRRFGRSVDKSVKEEVETLSPEQIEMMSSKTDGVDPNSMYPAFPQNHPRERLILNTPPISRCPTENGVIHTPWGTVSGGAIIAGIAAGVESQLIRIDELIKHQIEPRVSGYENDILLDSKYLATLAGDLAEVALKQGPQIQNGRYTVGVEGRWNSTQKPLYYFLNSNENLEMTGAEIRGGIDGLILASKVPQYYEKSRNLRLSQVLDMYYGERGLFDSNIRACKRRDHILTVAPTETLQAQTLSAAILLSPEITPATFSAKIVEGFVKQAVEDLNSHIPTMNRDETCDFSTRYFDASQSSNLISEPAANLTIVVDTTWSFEMIEKILWQFILSSKLHISKFNSQYTILNAADGSIILNSTHYVNDFSKFNQTIYNRLRRGFDLPKTLDNLRRLQTENLNREQKMGWDSAKSDVVVVIPYQSSLSQEDKYYCNETLKKMQEDVPDATFLFLTYGSKDRWFDVVVNPDTDIISISTGESSEYYPAVDTLITRIKQVPRRLINTQCGASYDRIGSSQPMRDSIVPGSINYYRMHPNYFFSDSDSSPKIKIQTQDSLLVCASRELLHENATEAQAKADCSQVSSGRPLTITLDCDGASYIHDCRPFYLSVGANTTVSSSFSCSDLMKCRYPDSILFTISYENLVCRNGVARLLLSPIILLIVFAQYFY